MALEIDIPKGKKAAELLCSAFEKEGIFGHSEMPEDVNPIGVESGSLDHILFLTLTVSIDYQRDAPQTWASARRTFEDAETRYLFNPQILSETSLSKIIEDLKKHGLSKKPRQDAFIWHTVGVSFFKKWEGDPRKFLADCEWDSPTILARLKGDQHLANNRFTWDYPFLRGDKIGPLWVRMLHDSAGITTIKNFDRVPIPVDIHIARASLMLGAIKGDYDGAFTPIPPMVRNVWFECVKGCNIKGRPMIALDLDEPLWHLSKYGCTHRNPTSGICPVKHKCIARELCMLGIISVSNATNSVRIETQIGM
jgi:hypothetical protein